MTHRPNGLNDDFTNDVNVLGNLNAKRLYGDASGLTGVPVGTETDPVFNAASSAYNEHIASTAIHYAVGTISHTSIQDIGTNTHTQIDTHIASNALHFTSNALWTATNANTASCALINPLSSALDTHIASQAIHFTSNAIWASVAAVQNIANSTSSAYNTHVASQAIHFTSNALWASMATVMNIINSVSGAYYTHAGDSSDPHGATLSQTYLNVASCAITADNIIVSQAFVRNIVLGTDATPPTAYNFTQGTVYIQYTP